MSSCQQEGLERPTEVGVCSSSHFVRAETARYSTSTEQLMHYGAGKKDAANACKCICSADTQIRLAQQAGQCCNQQAALKWPTCPHHHRESTSCAGAKEQSAEVTIWTRKHGVVFRLSILSPRHLPCLILLLKLVSSGPPASLQQHAGPKQCSSKAQHMSCIRAP